jgi:ubiquinone/menaquinone biosynthesis C-methylase UbiE
VKLGNGFVNVSDDIVANNGFRLVVLLSASSSRCFGRMCGLKGAHINIENVCVMEELVDSAQGQSPIHVIANVRNFRLSKDWMADMSEHSRPYVIDSNDECERLELQARLAKIEQHLRYLPVSPRARVLDAGCGSGSMSRLIARSFPDAEVTGVDLREQYLDFAGGRARSEQLDNVQFQVADVFALPFADASFDVVWTKYLLQWLKEPKRALNELKRVTRPGGTVVSCDFAGFAIEHFPVNAKFGREVRRVMTSLVDCNIGRKVGSFMISLGFINVRQEVEADKIFTVIGRIDAQRRWNWEKQFKAARPHLIQIIGSDKGADRFVTNFLSIYDDPATSSITTLHFTRGHKPTT